MNNTGAAERAFQELLRQYPDGNAVDNAYSWMAIIERCAGRNQLADELNQEIMRQFPFTRHAQFARARPSIQTAWIDSDSCGGGQRVRD